jgi:hypothetical protein
MGAEMQSLHLECEFCRRANFRFLAGPVPVWNALRHCLVHASNMEALSFGLGLTHAPLCQAPDDVAVRSRDFCP